MDEKRRPEPGTVRGALLIPLPSGVAQTRGGRGLLVDSTAAPNAVPRFLGALLARSSRALLSTATVLRRRRPDYRFKPYRMASG
ncbi:hypothetical protein GCM10023347_12780 [Streptomyces chumphonensis]|uniref:Uncharacterized protein n=1 Tax=Streptomyces chumphonensis TaxID=1214925 RepID=A0A927EZ44_9ACTN|nr:hypothetical protein [Streptomyces chumphonensis]MBD3932634.1 hypothetical protein [Streptomyces chumphonensis]